MGSYWSSFYSTEKGATTPTDTETNRRGKRANDTDLDTDNLEDPLLYTPQKKKLKSTTDYIYQVLFVNGENSDITITALGKEWKLHKIYLKQCGYFDSMFNGSWREAEASSISLDIPDDNIDVEALSIAFGCLYRDDFTIEPVKVVPVLAAACLLQLDGLMQQCAVIMMDTISMNTVCEYYECSVTYGLTLVTAACFKWFENNIMYKQTKILLKHISSQLLQQLIESPDLFVMQVEMDVYNLLKRWLFLQLVPGWSGSYRKELTKQADAHFKEAVRQEFGRGSSRSYLETKCGRKYKCVFATLRLQHILVDLTSTNTLLKDRLLPKEWLMPYFKAQWMTMLRVEQGEELGPKKEEVEESIFNQQSLRCARVLNRDTEHQWRWIGFNYGVDLVVTYTGRTIILKRNSSSHNRLLSTQSRRYVMFKVTVSCLNDLGQVTYTKTSGVVTTDFEKDGQVLALSVDRKATMPLRVALNLLYITPKLSDSLPNLLNIRLPHTHCGSCRRRRKSVTAIASTSCTDIDGSQCDVTGRADSPAAPSPSSVGSSEGAASTGDVDSDL